MATRTDTQSPALPTATLAVTDSAGHSDSDMITVIGIDATPD